MLSRSCEGLPIAGAIDGRLRAHPAAGTPSTFTFDPDRYRGTDRPTLLLRGAESSPEMHVGVDLVHDAIAGSRVLTMPGVDHEAVTTGLDVLSTTLTSELSTKQPSSR